MSLFCSLFLLSPPLSYLSSSPAVGVGVCSAHPAIFLPPLSPPPYPVYHGRTGVHCWPCLLEQLDPGRGRGVSPALRCSLHTASLVHQVSSSNGCGWRDRCTQCCWVVFFLFFLCEIVVSVLCINSCSLAFLWQAVLMASRSYGKPFLWQAVLMASRSYGKPFLWQAVLMASRSYGKPFLWQAVCNIYGHVIS